MLLLLTFLSLCRPLWKDIRDVHLLMIGDSVVRMQKDHIHALNLISRKYLDYKTPYVQFFPNESTIPDILNSTRVFDKRMDRKGLNIVFTNFGAHHLLHLHPIRKWTSIEGEVDKVVDGSMQASFRGFYNLEKWIRRDVALLLSTPYIDLVILMTPNTVCSSRFHNKYATWFKRKEPLSQCIDYVLHEAATSNEYLQTLFFCSPPKDFSPTEAANLCAKGSLSINGTFAITTVMKSVVKSMASSNIKILDAANITANCGCNCTLDGRHYNSDVVQEQTFFLAETILEFKKIKT